MNINRNVYVLLAVLLLFATISSFVINVKGDTKIATNEVQPLAFPITGEDVLYVYPSSVPRYCDVFVKTYPNTEVKVYRINGQDTGIKCTTNDEGECTFKFGLKESKGLYYAQAKDITTNLYLDATKACDLTYKTDRLEILPDNLFIEAGNEFTFDVNSYVGEQLIESSKDYNLSDTFRATIVDSNDTNVEIFVTGAGEVELTAYSGKQTASSHITILPNACADIFDLTFVSNYFAGHNIEHSYVVMDPYGNLKPNTELLSVITLPNGETVNLTLISDESGVATLIYPVNISGDYTLFTTTLNQICGNKTITNYVTVLPDYNSLSVNLMRGEEELNDVVSIYVDDEFTFKFIATDAYSNILDENSYTCLINSTDSNIFEYLSGETWNEYRILSGHLTGEANLTYNCYYATDTEPFDSGYITIRTTGNLNNPDAIYVVSPPNEMRAGENATLEFVLLDSYGYVIEEDVVYTFNTLYGEVINNTYFAPTYLGGEVLLVDEITISYGDVNTTIQINIIPNVPHTLEFNTEIIEIEQNQPFTLSVIARDEFNNLIPNIEINFTIVSGPATLNEMSALTNVEGISSVNGLSGNTNGTVVYSASYNDIIVYGEFYVLEPLLPPSVPTTIVCEAVPGTLFVDEQSTITCTVRDQYNEVLEGALVTFVASGGTLSQLSAITTDTGRVTINFQSGVEGVYTINSTSGEVSDIVTINVEVPDVPGIYSGNVINQDLVAVPGTTIKVLLNGALVQLIEVDGLGNFNLELQPGIYDVVVEAPGYLTIYDYGLVVVSSDNVVKNYVLTTLSRLSGVVTNQTSDLIVGANVEIYRNNKLVDTMQTNLNGEYTFTVASGIYTVKVIDEDYVTSYFSLYLAPSTEVERNVVIYR